MKKLYLSLLLAILVVSKTAAQDFVSDSIRTEYSKATSDSGKITALISLAKHNWYDLFKDDTAVIILNSGLVLAKDKGLNAEEIEIMIWLSKFYSNNRSSNHDLSKAYQLAQKALSLSRQYSLKAQEADALVSLSYQLTRKPDSAKLLVEQALSLAWQYKLVDQQINALTGKATLYTVSKPDSAKAYLLKAITLARQSQSPTIEITLLQRLATAYSFNHWGDSTNYLMQEAVGVARKNGLVDQEINLLHSLIASESGFFLKDSLDAYYERVLSLSRQFKRDSLRVMAGVAQSATDIGDFPEALKINLSLLHAYEEKKDSTAIENVLYGIALAYEATNDYKKTIDYLYKAEKYREHDKFIYIFIHVDFAKAYLALKQTDSARFYAAKAYKLAIDYYGTATDIYGGVLNDLGSVYDELKEDSLAIDYLRRSYVYFTTQNFQYLNYCASTMGLAKYFKRKNMADSSFFYARLSLATARDKGFLPVISESSALVADYFQSKHNMDSALHYQQIGFEAYKTLYNDESSRQFQNMSFSEQQREKDIALAKKMIADQYASNLRLYALITVITVAILIGLIVFRNNRQRRKSYDLLQKQKIEIDLQKSKLENSLNELQATQSQLIQSEKMASLGELTAGIAHEIQNPLNFVNNFSEVSRELIDELKSQKEKLKKEDQDEILNDIDANLEKINHHGKRADAIVKGMLQHSRSNAGIKELTDINALADEYLRLSYHGIRAKDKSFNADIKTDFDAGIGKINIIPQDIGRALLNLYNNAFYSVNEKKNASPGSGLNDQKYEPVVSVSTKKLNDRIEIRVRDNGNGIPQKVVDKIFQPFFTTKPTGQGTGLGLSLSYDIVKAHGGEIKVETKEGDGAEFIILLYVNT